MNQDHAETYGAPGSAHQWCACRGCCVRWLTGATGQDSNPLSAGPSEVRNQAEDGRIPATWPASTSTLISGERDAVLVDALLTTSEGQRLAAWVPGTGMRLRAIFVTHGHADHFFGAGPLLEAFPHVQLMACDQQGVDEGLGQAKPTALASWNSRFPGQLTQSPAIPDLA